MCACASRFNEEAHLVIGKISPSWRSSTYQRDHVIHLAEQFGKSLCVFVNTPSQCRSVLVGIEEL